MYPWISRTLDFWLQFCEKKCGLYMDVYGTLRATPTPLFQSCTGKGQSLETGNPTMFWGGGCILELRGEVSLKNSKRAICLNTFVAHCKTKNDWTPETTGN